MLGRAWLLWEVIRREQSLWGGTHHTTWNLPLRWLPPAPPLAPDTPDTAMKSISWNNTLWRRQIENLTLFKYVTSNNNLIGYQLSGIIIHKKNNWGLFWEWSITFQQYHSSLTELFLCNSWIFCSSLQSLVKTIKVAISNEPSFPLSYYVIWSILKLWPIIFRFSSI